MISVSGVSMRFGSKVLFEDVTTTFSAGRRYGLTGPERRRQVHVHEAADRRTAAAARNGRPSGEARRPAPGPVRLRRVPRHRHRDHGQPAPLERARGARRALRQARHDQRGRHAPRRARGHRRRRRRLHGRERRGDPAAGPRHPRRAARADDGASCRADRRCACCWRRRSSAIRRRCCSTSRPTTSTSTRSTGCEEFLDRYDGTLIVISHDRHFLNNVCTHIADIDYETIITYTGGYDDMVMAKTQIRSRIEAAERAAREEDRAAQRLHRALLAPARAPARCSRAARKSSGCRRPSWRARTSSVPTSSSRRSGRRARSPLEFEGVSQGLRRACR